MSIERELLVEAVEWMHELEYVWANVRVSGDYDLLDLIVGINKIKEFLDQPEEENVYQKILRIEDGIEAEILPSELWFDGYETGRKDPQKRESIEDGELEVWYSQHTWAMDKQEYIWGFRDAEKCYGIGV